MKDPDAPEKFKLCRLSHGLIASRLSQTQTQQNFLFRTDMWFVNVEFLTYDQADKVKPL